MATRRAGPYLTVVYSGINGLLSCWLVDRISARFVTQSNYIMPIATLLLGAAVLSESLAVLQYVGMAVVIAALVLSEGRGRKTPDVAPAE